MNLYVLAAVGVVTSGLALTSYALYQRSESAIAKLDFERARTEALTSTVKQQEEQTVALLAANEALNATLVEREKRARQLERDRQTLRKALDELKPLLAKEDQECLDRPLPPAIAGKLRDS